MVRIRSYPHFDSALSEAEALALVHDPVAVARHPFFPFIEYSERWTKFAAKGKQGSVKSRPIKYAARRDSCIYSHYRSILQNAYEAELSARGLSDSVLAYRRVPRFGSKGFKNNIHFANDTFDRIAKLGNCLVYTLDISKFFETIDDGKLKQQWIRLINFPTLPPDH